LCAALPGRYGIYLAVSRDIRPLRKKRKMLLEWARIADDD
jgi:hypothetical protein